MWEFYFLNLLGCFYVAVCRYAQLEVQECSVITEICINIQRKGEVVDTPFVCRVGEIMVRLLYNFVDHHTNICVFIVNALVY